MGSAKLFGSLVRIASSVTSLSKFPFEYKIKARGGQVIFLRPPSSGDARKGEKIAYPRGSYWDKLLQFTNTPGIYFEDYPEIADFDCPEWSHLSKQQAIVYTKKIIEILQKEKGWTFSNKQSL